MVKNLVLGPTLATLDQIWAQKFFYLYYMLDIVASYHCTQLQGKLMNHTWENAKKTSFGTNFGPFGPNLVPRNFLMDFASTTC